MKMHFGYSGYWVRYVNPLLVNGRITWPQQCWRERRNCRTGITGQNMLYFMTRPIIMKWNRSPPHSSVSSSLLSSPLSSSITPSLLHSFTPGSKPTFSTNPSHLRFLLPTGLLHDNGTGPDLGPIMFIVLFLVSHFNFLFVPCGGLSWLPVSFLLHVKYTVSYRIVS